MALPQSSPDLYQHVRVVISIIVGLCITTLLSGFSRFVQHPKREKVSLLHLGWAASLLLWIIHFWWWEYRLQSVQVITFAVYLFLICFCCLFYFLCVLLNPPSIDEYGGFEEYFISRRRWFFGLLAVTYAVDLIDNLVGDGHVTRALRDARVGVVHRREHARRHAAGDAADVHARLLGAVERAVAASGRGARLAAACLVGHRRDATVGRIDDHRAATRGLAALEPVRRRRRRGPDGSGVRGVGRLDVELGVVARELRGRLFQPLREFLVGEHLAIAERRVAFERHAELRRGRPHTLKIRLTPRRLRRLEIGRGERERADC